MPEHSAQEVAQMYDCKTPNCTGLAKSNRGPYAYLCEGKCKPAAIARAQQAGQSGVSGANPARPAPARRGSKVAQLDGIKKLAVAADKALERADKLTRKALEAKAVADAAVDQYQAALREATS